jgi:hypothetical protein
MFHDVSFTSSFMGETGFETNAALEALCFKWAFATHDKASLAS